MEKNSLFLALVMWSLSLLNSLGTSGVTIVPLLRSIREKCATVSPAQRSLLSESRTTARLHGSTFLVTHRVGSIFQVCLESFRSQREETAEENSGTCILSTKLEPCCVLFLIPYLLLHIFAIRKSCRESFLENVPFLY